MPGVTEGTSSGDGESGFGRNIRTAYNGYLAGDSVAKAVVASGFIEYLLSPDENNAVPTDIEGVIRRLEASGYPGLMNVLTSIPEVAAIMNRVLIPDGEDYRRDENGLYVVADGYVGNSALGQLAFNDLLATLGEAAPLYSSIVSNNRYTEAMYASAMRGRVESGETLSEDEAKALSSIVGERLSGKLVRAGAQFYDINTGAWSSGTTRTVDGGGIVFNPTKDDDGNGNISWDISNLPEDVQTWIREKQKNGETINYETLSVNDYIGWARAKNESIGKTALSDIEGDYYDTLINNAAYGISGLTTRQKIAGANTIFGHIAQGTVGNLLLSTESDVIDAYMSAYENMPAYVSMAQIVEGISDT